MGRRQELMRHYLELAKSIFQIEQQIEQSSDDHCAWVFGNTVGLDPRRYLIITTNVTANELQVGSEEIKKGARRDSRALARLAQADIPGRILDSEQIDRIFVIKISPGSLVSNIHGNHWEICHINDLLAKMLFGYQINELIYHKDALLSPIKEAAVLDPRRVVSPDVCESGQSERLNGVDHILKWAVTPASCPFLVIFGVGGLGKTKLLELAAHRLWQGFLNYQHTRLPVLVPMKGIPAGAAPDLAAHISTFALFNKRTTASQIGVLITSGILTIFLDAFDEHLKFSNRSDAVRFLQMLKQNFAPVEPACQARPRIAFTSRDYYLTTDVIFDEILQNELQRCTLQPFDKMQRYAFISMNAADKIGGNAVNAWSDSLERVVGSLDNGCDYLVGHSLFLLAFCQFICNLDKSSHPDESHIAVRTPDDFERLESASLFDKVLELINQREFIEKSNWDTAVTCDLNPIWHQSPFTPDKQETFFALLAKLILEDKEYYQGKAKTINIQGLLINNLVERSLRDTIGIPKAADGIKPEVARQIELEALERIVEFFRQHPLVDSSNTGFLDDSRFKFKYPTYMDYFIKQYLSMRFQAIAQKLEHQASSRKEAIAQLEEFIFELFDGSMMERATNALFFLCWDNAGLKRLSFLMNRLFNEPNELESDLFRYLLYYCLIFVKLFTDLRGRRIDITGLCFDNSRDTEIVILDGQDLNPYLKQLNLFLCTFGNMGLKNTVFQNCNLFGISVRSLAFDGLVEFNGGDLFIMPELYTEEESESVNDEILSTDALYPIGRNVTLRLDGGVRVHNETLEIFQALARKYSNVVLQIGTIETVDFYEALPVPLRGTQPILTPGRRLIDQLMRLARKHRRGSFGVLREKLFGRSSVRASNASQIEEFLIDNEILEARGSMFLIVDPKQMYHPEGNFGHMFSEVVEYWSPLIERLNEILID